MFSIGQPSRQQFATDVCEAIQDLSGIEFEYDAAEFQLVQKDPEEQGIINLFNLYREHCDLNREARKANILRIASIFAGRTEQLPASLEDAKPRLFPKIWNRSSLEHLKLQRQLQGGESPDLAFRSLGSHLCSALVYDTDTAMRSISNEELQQWGVSFGEAFEIAIENLDQASTVFSSIGNHLHSSVSGDNYDSARILLLDRIRSFDVVGEHVVAVPQRDAMYIAGSDDAASLRMLFELTEMATSDEPRPLSPLPLILKNGEWVDWVPPRNHVLREKHDQLELQFLGQLYAEQKQLLDLLFEAKGEDTFVSSFSALRKEGSNRMHSYCVWGRGIKALLPRTQLVMFADEEHNASGEWEHVVSVVGDFMEPDDSYHPMRYRISEYPSAEQLAAIGTAELLG